jgi:hypothetical protein
MHGTPRYISRPLHELRNIFCTTDRQEMSCTSSHGREKCLKHLSSHQLTKSGNYETPWGKHEYGKCQMVFNKITCCRLMSDPNIYIRLCQITNVSGPATIQLQWTLFILVPLIHSSAFIMCFAPKYVYRTILTFKRCKKSLSKWRNKRFTSYREDKRKKYFASVRFGSTCWLKGSSSCHLLRIKCRTDAIITITMD